MEGQIILKFNVQIHKTLVEKNREELNDPASSNHIVKIAATWNDDLTSSNIYKTKQKKISYLFIERLRKLYNQMF